jgi:hypothetical protein
VLLFDGALDPITPPSFGDEVLAEFPNATHVIVPAGGHGVAYYDDCTHSILLAYETDPNTTPDTSCTADLPVPFAR